MTNTLHRQGSDASLLGDYVIFPTTARGINHVGSGPKKKQFALICLAHGPVNFGIHDYVPGTASIVEQFLRNRKEPEYYDADGHPTDRLVKRWYAEVEAITDGSGPNAVFDSLERLSAVVADLKEVDLGMSINISGLHAEVDAALRAAGIVRHTIEHSLGFHGRTERLPAPEILELSSMCGHGMVSFNLVKRMIDLVKKGRLTPMRAAEYLAKPCTCDVFNPVRAAKLLEEASKRV